MGVTSYDEVLDDLPGMVLLSVYFRNRGPEVVDYALVLLHDSGGRMETIRVYDSTHGSNEMHRHAQGGGKQDGVVFSRATLGEGMRSAIKDIKDRYLAMIRGWEEWR
jgi:hypothetical protein